MIAERCLAICLALASGAAGAAPDGEYLLNAAGCRTCHTAEDGVPLAGGRAFDTPFGTFYAPNITADQDTGIGTWSVSDFITALKHGRAPDGSAYFPVFPFTSYRLMRDQDAAAIYEYLMRSSAVRQANRPHQLPWWLGRWMMIPWQWWLQPEPSPLPADPTLARGHYLVDALGHCGECHTARDWAGTSDTSRYLAGTLHGPEGDKVPNITPHPDDGIGKWDQDDLAWFLQSGELPDGDYTGGLMTAVIDHATAKLTDADRRAMAAYLKSITPRPGP